MDICYTYNLVPVGYKCMLKYCMYIFLIFVLLILEARSLQFGAGISLERLEKLGQVKSFFCFSVYLWPHLCLNYLSCTPAVERQ